MTPEIFTTQSRLGVETVILRQSSMGLVRSAGWEGARTSLQLPAFTTIYLRHPSMAYPPRLVESHLSFRYSLVSSTQRSSERIELPTTHWMAPHPNRGGCFIPGSNKWARAFPSGSYTYSCRPDRSSDEFQRQSAQKGIGLLQCHFLTIPGFLLLVSENVSRKK